MAMTTISALDRLKTQHPEWAPWLAVIEEILRETETGKWDAGVPPSTRPHDGTAPLIAGAALTVKASAVRRLVERLVRTAASGETPKMATLKGMLDPELDVLTLFNAAICRQDDRIEEIAEACRAEPEALQAVAALLPVPFLQACNRRWASSIPGSWVEGYCPVCAAWPAFAEVRGIERNRFFRCGRCGAAWHARPLRCPYCATIDHGELVSLVPEKNDAHATIDACRRCLGYVKTFARLQGCAAGAVIVEDLASAALDVAAIEEGYSRPGGAGYPLDVTITARSVARRVFAWNA
jgi:FdhE protein